MPDSSQAKLAPEWVDLIREVSGATRLVGQQAVQSLWSGYGQIIRCCLEGGTRSSVIVKHVRWPGKRAHPRGWNSDRSHQRKLKSYEVESAWYRAHAETCGGSCRVPRCLALETRGDEVFMVLEDLDIAGFERRCTHVSDTEVEACLSWLANFHATFLGRAPEGLWEVGTYWHLATRPDELERIGDGDLKQAAPALDAKLSAAQFQTFVHGDAKLANFCFSTDGQGVAAVDFQYVGGGCGMKDLAYFVSSCFDENECERREEELLTRYFACLRNALNEVGSAVDFTSLETEWRALYPVAWTDFFRFLQGWSPGHWKIHRYSERMAREVLATL